MLALFDNILYLNLRILIPNLPLIDTFLILI